jgi:uncharacterized protein YcsI (UPF0317 family)
MRDNIRSGDYQGNTAGMGKGFLQGNLVILPEAFAFDFMKFCQRNPKPCPLIGVSDVGDPMLRTLGHDIDIRTDVPLYNVYQNGVLDETRPDISDLWQPDSVAFVLGCSFTFEAALIGAGIPLWHIENNKNVSIYRTNVDTVPSGPFSGPTVVSMRAIHKDKLDQAIEVSSRFPLAHGTPVHWGDPADIGIANLANPDWGDVTPMPEDHLPVFWACGVTPQAAIECAGVPLCITHTPGCMLITDIPDTAEIPVLTQ